VSVVAFVIVPEQMQEPVEREDAKLGRLGVAGLVRLPAGDATGDSNVAEEPITIGIRD
jgi:hypothetical protein